MKTLRQTCAGAVLTLLLSAPAFAGQINCPGAASALPPKQTSEIPETIETVITESVTTIVMLAIVDLIN